MAMKANDASTVQEPSTKHCLQHVLSCDNDPKVLDWIRKAHSPTILALDLQDCLDSVVWNDLTKEFVPFKAPDICICSWACQDVKLGCPYFEQVLSFNFTCLKQVFGPVYRTLVHTNMKKISQ